MPMQPDRVSGHPNHLISFPKFNSFPGRIVKEEEEAFRMAKRWQGENDLHRWV